MFLLLLAVNLAVALVTTILVVVAFRGPIAGILGRIVQDPVAAAWRRYLTFALVVVGISSGVNLRDLQRYTRGGAPQPQVPAERVVPGEPGAPAPAPPEVAPLNSETWTLEVYRTAISSLGGLAGALLLFFGIALVVSAIQRAAEIRVAPPGLGSRPVERMGRGGGGRDVMSRSNPRPVPDRRSPSGPDPRRRGGGEGRGPREEPFRGGGDLRRREGGRGGGESRGGESRGSEPRLGVEPRAVESRAVEPRGAEPPAGDDDRRAPGNGPQELRPSGPRRHWGR